MRTVQELEQEIERLRAKLSPLEDKNFTALFKELMTEHSALEVFNTVILRGNAHYKITPELLWRAVVGPTYNIHDITKLGRTLRALGWVQTAKDGKRYYIIPVSEYHEQIR